MNDRTLCQRLFADYPGQVPITGRVDQRRARGEGTRAEILHVAANLASRDGVEGLTLGALADALQMSKSGVVRHFGSREKLQLETVRHAEDVFASIVLSPAQGHRAGLDRLRRLVDAWLDYLVGDTFTGGCFFYAAAAELDRRPGPLRDAIAASVRAGLASLRDDLTAAVAAGALAPGTDVDHLLFELHAYLQEVSTSHLLLEDPKAAEHGRAAVEGLIRRHSEPRG